ncbi:ALP1-like protein [Tanacetum coccineum]
MSSDLFFYTSSDDEGEVNSELVMFTEACQAAYEASKPKVQRTPVERDRYGAHDRLVMAYFSEHPQYDEATFRERFRMSRRLFTKIVREVTDASHFFQQRDGCTGQRGISSLMKCTFAIRQMAYGSVPDSLDEYLQMDATTARKSLQIFCKHEAARKDVERAFGVLKQKWKLIKYPARGMSRKEQHRDNDPVRIHEESMQVTQEIVNRTARLKRVGGWEWADMMVLYCQNAAEEDSEFARCIGVLLQEMVAAYDDRVDFIRELEAVPGIAAAVKTAEFLNDALESFVDELDMLAGRHVPGKMPEFMRRVQGKDIPNLMKLQILEREFELRAQEKGVFIEKLKGNVDF